MLEIIKLRIRQMQRGILSLVEKPNLIILSVIVVDQKYQISSFVFNVAKKQFVSVKCTPHPYKNC